MIKTYDGIEGCEELISASKELHRILYNPSPQEIVAKRERSFHFPNPNAKEITENAEQIRIKLMIGDVLDCDVGWRVWEAAFILCRWMTSHPLMFHKKRILEVGAGLGLCGLVASHLADEVILSDYKDEIMQILSQNISLNPKCSSICSTVKLDWFDTKYNEMTPFDIIIGSEVHYEVEASKQLAHVLESLLVPGGKFIGVSMNQRYRNGLVPFIEEIKQNCPSLSVSVQEVGLELVSDFTSTSEWVFIECTRLQ